MRLLVCGGRDWSNRKAVWAELDRLKPTFVIQGGARGVDLDARIWAKRHHVPCVTVVADWEKYGKAAGPIRNQRMLDDLKPDTVLVFPGNRGTADMAARAQRQLGITVIHWTPETGAT
jgi:hypothetical protein